jgi:aerotaxis receptor
MRRPEPIDEEYTFSDGIIVSSTDLRGIITYANRKFCEIANYSKKELIGKNHNIIRHPDMPKTAFEGMWDTIKKGKSWNGLVKNLRKDGKYYWVSTHITPIKDNTGEVLGYTAARRPANKEEIEEVVPQYKSMLLKETNN